MGKSKSRKKHSRRRKRTMQPNKTVPYQPPQALPTASLWTQAYQQYQLQHAQMSQWLQQVHQSAYISQYSHGYNTTNRCVPHNCCNRRLPCGFVSQRNCCMQRVPPVPVDHYSGDYPVETRTYQRTSSPLDVVQAEEEDEDEDAEDEEGSEDELVFNVDAILELRATREISDRESEESFELLDGVDDMLEHLKMGASGSLECYSGKLGVVNVGEDAANSRGELLRLYGETGAKDVETAETLLAAKYERLCDELEPSVWPVIPLRL